MTYETYVNLINAAEKRLRLARVVGDWKTVAEVAAELVRIRQKFHEEHGKAQENTND